MPPDYIYRVAWRERVRCNCPLPHEHEWKECEQSDIYWLSERDVQKFVDHLWDQKDVEVTMVETWRAVRPTPEWERV